MGQELLNKIIKGYIFKMNQLSGAWIYSKPFLDLSLWYCELTCLFCSRPSEVNENNSSQRSLLEEGIKPEQRTNSMSG